MDDSIKAAKSGVELVGEIMKVAGDNPDVREAGKNLGQAAKTLAKTINVVLLPLAAVNFAYDKAKIYFEEKFEKDLSEKVESIPTEHIVEPKASIAGPALQALAFTHEEPDLKAMYLNLLATAMDGRIAEKAHPAFVELIRQLNSAEAKLLSSMNWNKTGIPIVELRTTETGEDGWRVIYTHLLHAHNKETGSASVINELPMMVDNWIRLGLIEVDYSVYVVGEDQYSWVEGRPEYLKYKEIIDKQDRLTLTFAKGRMRSTEFGATFAAAVGISLK